METKTCPACEGLGLVPADPETTQAELLADVVAETRKPPPASAARFAAAERELLAGRKATA
jgi:hypothetical protein